MKVENQSAEKQQLADWHRIQKRYPEANFLQSPAWQRTNQLIGHEVVILQPRPETWCLCIVKNAKRGRYLEVPGGPLVDWQDETAVAEIFDAIKRLAKAKKCVFIRLRAQLRRTDANVKSLAKLGCQPAPMHLHAEHTVMIDLVKSEDELLANMRRQTRYEVRRSAKLGITVDWGNSEELFYEFHQVQAETAARQHFVPPDLKTLLAEREAFGDNARLYVAKTAEGEPIAYGLILIEGVEAEYFEAASTDLNRKLPGSYALEWQVMKDLKALHVARYNLWGIAPHGQKNHRYAGVTTFKTGFGGEIVEFVPAQDIVINHFKYLLNLAVEKLRKRMRHL